MSDINTRRTVWVTIETDSMALTTWSTLSVGNKNNRKILIKQSTS